MPATLPKPPGTIAWPKSDPSAGLFVVPAPQAVSGVTVCTSELMNTLLSPEPLPVKLPLKLSPLALFVMTVPESCARLMAPVMFVEETEFALAAAPALDA